MGRSSLVSPSFGSLLDRTNEKPLSRKNSISSGEQVGALDVGRRWRQAEHVGTQICCEAKKPDVHQQRPTVSNSDIGFGFHTNYMTLRECLELLQLGDILVTSAFLRDVRNR